MTLALVPDVLVRPAYLWVPPHVSTAGGDAADLAALAGLDLDGEQRLMVDAVLAERADGRWAALESAIVEARQNGKTLAVEVIVLAHLFLFDARLITWTAHLFRTTQEAFRHLDQLIAGTPELSRRVVRVSRANGEEGFELEDDRRLLFLARSKTGGRGLTGDVVVLDEAFALTPSEMGSLLPTLSARPNPQVIYASSAGMVGSSILRGLRDRGRKGGDPSLAYIEWCAPEGGCVDDRCTHQVGVEGCVLDDVEQWRRANHTLGRRISVANIEAERRSLPPEEFARERLGWWDEPAVGETGIVAEAWKACADRAAEPAEPVALAVDVSPGHASAAIVACGGGVLHVVEHKRGTSWVAARLVELVAEHEVIGIGFDPAGPVHALVPDLETAGLKMRSDDGSEGVLVGLTGRDAVQACEMVLAAVGDRSLVHRDQKALNDAVAGASRRAVGDSWKWSRKDSTADISPLVAATVARWLWTTHTPEPDPAEPNIW